MRPRIAIPMPHSVNREYSERAISQYERAVEQAGGEPIRILLDQPQDAVTEIVGSCDGVLLPGSNADVDPAKFNAQRSAHTAASDPPRDAADELMLRDAYSNRKPILGICYGLQSLNVYRGGSLIQHIPDFLPEDLRGRVNHEAGKKVAIAHAAEIQKDSTLGKIAGKSATSSTGGSQLVILVNSSHHQSADAIGTGLRVAAHCPADGIIEALEGTDPNHFVLAVQWHPERSIDEDEASRAIFLALTEAAQARIR
jgi:putative glutamine amidotransferase